MFREIVGHEGPKGLLEAAVDHGRVAHAYLFHGEEAIGKRLTALRFAQALNCDVADARGCGRCRSCLHIESRTHPDVLFIDPDREMANPQIKIEQVRDIEHHIMYRPLIGDWKVILIDDADRLTLSAANALLKTLEEPPPHSVFILITSRPFALPGTIKSRCQTIRFVAPARHQVEAALIVARAIPPRDAHMLALVSEGRIGQALHMDLAALKQTHEDFRTMITPAALASVSTIFAVADALHKAGRVPETLAWLAQWLRDVLLVAVGAPRDLLVHADHLAELDTMANAVKVDRLLALLAEIETIHRHATRNLNLQMALESLLLHLRDALLPSTPAAPAR